MNNFIWLTNYKVLSWQSEYRHVKIVGYLTQNAETRPPHLRLFLAEVHIFFYNQDLKNNIEYIKQEKYTNIQVSQ